MLKNIIVQGVDLTDPQDLRNLIVELTDGVWNTSDVAEFTEEDIELINAVRNYK